MAARLRARPGPKLDDADLLESLFRIPDDDEPEEDEEAEIGPVQLLSRRSIELYFMAKRYPGIPIFPGPLIAWPASWWHDERILRQFELRAQKEKRAEKKRQAWAEKARREMKAGI